MIYCLALGFALGIILVLTGNIELVAGFLAVMTLIYLGLRFGLKQKIYSYAALFCLVTLLGLVRVDYFQVNLENNKLQNFLGQKVVLRGTVVSPPKISNKGMGFEFEIEGLQYGDGGKSAATNGEKILVRYQGYDEWRYGQRLNITGTITKPENFLTDNGREFDYVNYLAKDQISFLLTEVEIEDLQALGGNWCLRQLYNLREAFVKSMNQVLSFVDTALMSGILLGKQDAIPKDIQDDFRASGLTHIMVLSGFNINVVGGAVSNFANIFVSKFWALGWGALAIVLFCLMSGAGTATVRASIMALIAVWGQITGRQGNAVRILVIVALLMIIWNPYALLYDPSFHLSFLASLGMVVLAPKILSQMKQSKFWSKLIRFESLQIIVAQTLATQICVLPYFLFKMGNFSVVALLANLLVLPIVPIAMLFGFLTGLLGFGGIWLAYLPAWLSSLLLWYMTIVAEYLGSLPWAVVNI